jgi:hypothetical protein
MNADPGKMDDDNDLGKTEPDMDAPGMEAPQESAHPNITAPKKDVNDTLKELGAGQPYPYRTH